MIISFLLLVFPRTVNERVCAGRCVVWGNQGVQMLSTVTFSAPAQQSGISSLGSGDAGIRAGKAWRETPATSFTASTSPGSPNEQL